MTQEPVTSPEMEQNLHDAGKLGLTTIAVMLSVVPLLLFIRASGVDKDTFIAASVMSVTTITVLIAWTFIKVVQGPRPLKKLHQAIIGFTWGNLGSVMVFTMAVGTTAAIIPMISFFGVFMVLGLNKCFGTTIVSTAILGFFVPLLAMGTCTVGVLIFG